MISPTTIESVRALNIVEVIGKYVPELKKAGTGGTYRAPSPFTNEKTPSFYVVGNRGFFKCFSSDKGGDHVTFVIEKFGLSYVDAIKTLCADFGIAIEYENEGHDAAYYDLQAALLKVNHATANHYRDQLHGILHAKAADLSYQHEAFTELIVKRRFTLDTLIQWKIGYAPGEVGDGYTPDRWRFLAAKVVSSGNYEHAEHLGLITTKDQVNYDTFRHRIIYPIIDEKGMYRGFGGRALKADQFNPKYLNSADSDVFKKSTVLYGLHYAGEAIRTTGFANLMEGYTDVISFHQAGHPNTVGTCGTALTDEQCKLLKKYTNRVVLFSEDEAAHNANMRNIDMLMQHGFLCSLIPMPSIIKLKPEHEALYAPLAGGPDQEGEAAPFKMGVGFITHRDKEKIVLKYGTDLLEFHPEHIDIAKVDPDELVRMFL